MVRIAFDCPRSQCAQKGDLSADTLIKWGIPIGGAAVLANPKRVADVIEAAKAWVAFLP